MFWQLQRTQLCMEYFLGRSGRASSTPSPLFSGNSVEVSTCWSRRRAMRPQHINCNIHSFPPTAPRIRSKADTGHPHSRSFAVYPTRHLIHRKAKSNFLRYHLFHQLGRGVHAYRRLRQEPGARNTDRHNREISRSSIIDRWRCDWRRRRWRRWRRRKWTVHKRQRLNDRMVWGSSYRVDVACGCSFLVVICFFKSPARRLLTASRVLPFACSARHFISDAFR